jgi:pimeloyl-ACP methyl ester carboxylesterase
MQGIDATNDIATRLARDGHMRVGAVKLPDGNHDVASMVPFRTDVHRAVSQAMLEMYPDDPLVLVGYSRGSSPAAYIAGEMASDIAGVSFIAPTWFSDEHTPLSLAIRGIEEGVGAALKESPRDRVELIRLGFHAVKEFVRRPMELRRDVSAIATEARPRDLIERLQNVPRIGVVVGDHDGVCREAEIISVAEKIVDSDPDRPVYIRRVKTGHFPVFTNPESRKTIIRQIRDIAA